jgi:ATPase subunit of ABC transporter with duplicated ATPase domains
MLARFDVMLLDEPTNDLDLDSLDRLEQFVVGVQGAIALVSHDREFLRRVVTDVAELDEFTHGLTMFAGGYDAFLRERSSLDSTPGRRGRSTTRRSRRWRNAPNANGSGRRKGCRERRNDPTTTTRTSRLQDQPDRTVGGARRRAPNERCVAWRSSSNRANRGICG